MTSLSFQTADGESSDLQPKLHHGSCSVVPEQVGKIIFLPPIAKNRNCF